MSFKGITDFTVDNEKFTAALLEYAAEFNEVNPIISYNKKNRPVRQKPLVRIPVSDYIAESIFKIACGLAAKPNYSGYTWKDEMIMDGVENCLRYIHNFKKGKNVKSKKDNGHAYATMIIQNSFWNRIKVEKENSKLKNKIMMNLDQESIYNVQEGDDTNYDNSYVNNLQKLATENAESKGTDEVVKKRKRKKYKKKEDPNSLASLLEDEND